MDSSPGDCQCADRAADDRALVELIYRSLACDRLRVHSQPIIRLADEEVHAEELLVRIATEDGALLLPEAFVPAAERHGLMPRIDRLMLEHGAALASCERPVHVNLSATTIADETFFDCAVATVDRHRADPAKITFEITETAAASDMRHGARLARKLVAHGFRIAIDDFGSGWGPFRYLRSFPVSMLKIDREFIRDVGSSPKAIQLVRGMVGLARALGHRTIGEGVEDECTIGIMRALGIDYAQGFYVGGPAPIDASLCADARRRLNDSGLLPA
jgi:EAL domain-containing protein (putative c-di-GMP-specific phosphodiesterase class I)